MQLSAKTSATPLLPAWEAPAAVLATLLAGGVTLLEALRPFPLPDAAYTFLALLSLLLSAALLSRRPSAAAMLASFLPALPLAALAHALEGAPAGARLFAALSLAFQGRCLLLWLASLAGLKRERLARALLARLPARVTVFVDNDIESEVELARLQEGHVFRVAPGATVPADGLVTFGSSIVDETFTARENLQLKGMGSTVLAGTVNKNGTLLVRATAVGDSTFLRRLARRAGPRGSEIGPGRILAADAAACCVAAALLAVSGPAQAALAFLAASAASSFAALETFELFLARESVAHLWLWARGGLARLADSGMLVLRAEGVLSEGRLKLSATESGTKLSEDAVLGLLGPLARKLEGPAAFAVLHELRARNIPLQQADFYQPRPDGGLAMVGSDEVRWIDLARAEARLELHELAPFVERHLAAGEEVHLLEREGKLDAAVAFRDTPVEGAPGAVEALRAQGLPILLVSSLPRRVVARMQTDLGVEHAQGECSEADVDLLMDRLRGEGLAPAWVQVSSFRPVRAAAVVAAASTGGDSPDLAAAEVRLPWLAAALSFARVAWRRLRSSLTWLFGCQAGLLLTTLGADGRIASRLGLGHGYALHAGALAVAGLLPGLLALAWLSLPGGGSDNV